LTTSSNPDLLLLIGAGIAAAVFVALGLTFARKPFAFVDHIGSRAAGVAVPVAVVFTRSGYSRELTVLAVAGTLLALLLRTNLVMPLLLIAFQLLGQITANGMKHLVARMRPEVWHFRHELGFAYPSGHAVTAIVFYLGWPLLIISQWPVPPEYRLALLAASIVWALGIGWSRLSLGAHRLTDVLGGYALGIAWLCVLLAFRTVIGA